MLTPLEKIKQAKELQENYNRLDQDLETTLSELEISEHELQCVLKMKGEDPATCWKVRDYLEDKLREKGVPLYPFSKMAHHSANKWFTYDTPWRNKKTVDCKGGNMKKATCLITCILAVSILSSG